MPLLGLLPQEGRLGEGGTSSRAERSSESRWNSGAGEPESGSSGLYRFCSQMAETALRTVKRIRARV